MNTVEAVVTKVLDVRPYRNFWITRVEVLSEGGYSAFALLNPIMTVHRTGMDCCLQPQSTLMS